jgi:hypothetical protein
VTARCYLRIGQNGRRFKFAATSRPSTSPIQTPSGIVLPTVQIGLVLQLPEGAFTPLVLPAIVVPRDLIVDVDVDAEAVST